MDTLSVRAQTVGVSGSRFLQNFMAVQKNSYDEEFNPNGICNCGVAENSLCENELIAKLQTIQVWKGHHIYYPSPQGQYSFREGLCRFFQRIFQLNAPLDPDRIVISSGLSGIMSLLGYVLGDPGDVFLIPTPYYTAFDHDISVLSNCALFRCPTLDQTNGKFQFCVEIFQKGYTEALNQGLRPRGIIIINPDNPTGEIRDEETIQPILKFAADHQLHVIFDEIYALSIFDSHESFPTVLKYSSIIDPQRTHFVWSFSKDFGLSGVRLGVLYAGSQELCASAYGANFICVPSIIVQEIVGALIADDEWIDWYIQLNRLRLKEQYGKVTAKFLDFDSRIRIRPVRAGLFLWVDFRLLLNEVTFDEEQRLFQIMFEHGVYISPGSSMGCSEPGWYRIIFTVKDQWMNEAMKRLKVAFDVYRRQSSN